MIRFTRIVNFKPHRWLRLKRLGIAVLALFAASVLLLVFERVRGARALKNRIGELVQRGEQFEISKLEPVRPDPAEDAAAALLLLTNRLDAATTNFYALVPPWNCFAAPGKAVVSSKLVRWSKFRGVTNTWASLGARLAEDPTLPDAVHAALLKPGWNDGFDYHKGLVDFPRGPVAIWMNTSVYLETCALAALHKGLMPVAVDRVEDMLRLVRHQANSSLMITELVRTDCGVGA